MKEEVLLTVDSKKLGCPLIVVPRCPGKKCTS